MSKVHLEKELNQYIQKLQKYVQNSKKVNKPQKITLRGKKLRKFRYLKMHSTGAGASEYTIEKDNWTYATWPIYHRVEPSKLYREILKKIQKEFPKFKPELLQAFTEKIIRLSLNSDIKGFHSKRNLIQAFFKEIEDKPLKYRFDLDITGLALQPKQIKISPNIFLEKTTKRDVEEAFPIDDFIQYKKYWHTALAKLHVEFLEKKDYIQEHKIERLLSILRLFKIADIAYNSIKETSESTNMLYAYNEKNTYRDHSFIFGAMLQRKDIQKLRKFWRVIEKFIPKSFAVMYTQHDYKAIAFERYKEAMNNPGIEEMRIAYVISGLEALFSTNDTELNYRLRMRVSRILSLLDMDSSKIYKDIGVAYGARSAFDHGGRLDSKEIFKIRRMYKNKDERILTMIILDYLRISIIAVIMSQQSKERLIDLIDKSWISKKELLELKKILKPTKNLLDLKHYKPHYSISPFNDADFSYVK